MGLCQSDLVQATEKGVLEQTYDFQKAKVVRVIDGDTFVIVAKHNKRLTRFYFRLYGCDCPEKNTEEGKAVKVFVKQALENKVVDIQVLTNKIHNGKKIREKFGRLIGFIYLNKENFTDRLVKNGMAKLYFGGRKE